jgi:hypothetical protein
MIPPKVTNIPSPSAVTFVPLGLSKASVAVTSAKAAPKPFTLSRKKSKVLLSPSLKLKAVLPSPGANVALIEQPKHTDGPSVAIADDNGAAATSNAIGDATAGFGHSVFTNRTTTVNATALALLLLSNLITRFLSTPGCVRTDAQAGYGRPCARLFS